LIVPDVIVPEPTFRDAPVMAPVTPNVPPTVALLVTPRVPPTVALLVIVAELRVETPDDDKVVNAPVEGVVLPTGVELIEPPEIVALLDEKLFATVAPLRVAVPSTIKLPFAEMSPVVEIVTPVEP
jgi:hypothetical protein